MGWFDWLLVAWWALGAFFTICQVGKPRDPITPRQAAISVGILGLLIVGLLATR